MAAFIAPIFGLLDRILPDKAANDAAKATLGQMALKGELDQIQGQIQTNIAEAQSKSIFVAGWRPAIGWVCGSAFGYNFVIRPLLLFAVGAHSAHIPPELNIAELSPVLMALLGLGVMRTVEKVQGADSNIKDSGH